MIRLLQLQLSSVWRGRDFCLAHHKPGEVKSIEDCLGKRDFLPVSKQEANKAGFPRQVF